MRFSVDADFIFRPVRRHLSSPTRNCLTSWGSLSFIMTGALQVHGRGRTALCRPVSPGALGQGSEWSEQDWTGPASLVKSQV